MPAIVTTSKTPPPRTMSASSGLVDANTTTSTDTHTSAPTSTTTDDSTTYELALPLPRTADTTLHVRLTVASKHVLVLLSTRSSGTLPVPSLAVPSLAVPGTVGASGDGGESLVNPMRVGDTAIPGGRVSLGSFVRDHAGHIFNDGMVIGGGMDGHVIDGEWADVGEQGNEKEIVCTPLIHEMATLETAERVARILARRVRRPVYLGCSISLAAMGGGGSVEEEMAVVGSIVRIVTERTS
ncbi:hypothetical protein ABW21_db0208310 [Orbilia brochopaga]|nr:hypothetical protein ABW21_db0208310 [Drechslerella brochopaga]